MKDKPMTSSLCGVVARLTAFIFIVCPAIVASAQEATDGPLRVGSSAPSADILSDEQWTKVDDSIQRALRWLAANQQKNGSFPTLPQGQPAVTSLGVMAFLSAGHTLEGGEYAAVLSDAVDFALDCQQADGLLSLPRTQPTTVRHNGSHTAYYNHGITGLMLGEVYGMTDAARSEQILKAIPMAINVLRKSQLNKRREGDRGGWQYYTHHLDVDSDMSSTTWQLMFLRSAKNAGFDVPEEMVVEAVKYVERCYDSKNGVFNYGLFGRERYTTVGSVGGGIISLSMGGKHNSPMVQSAGQWLLNQRFEKYNSFISAGGNYHYGLHYSSQAGYQLGGKYWRNLYPRIVEVLLKNQRADGSWPREVGIASGYGNSYSTALAILSLTPPYQLLPIYQR